MNRIKQFTRIQRQGLELFKKKNADYGDAFSLYGPIGIIVRMGDKIGRASTIEKKQITIVNDETMRDTLIDLHNYSAMALMLLDEENVKKKKEKNLKKEQTLKINNITQEPFGYSDYPKPPL
jgi:hypothetical protein